MIGYDWLTIMIGPSGIILHSFSTYIIQFSCLLVGLDKQLTFVKAQIVGVNGLEDLKHTLMNIVSFQK
jgi:hypothetical protein